MISLSSDLQLLDALWLQLRYLKAILMPFPLGEDYSLSQIQLITSFWDFRVVVKITILFAGTMLLNYKSSRRALAMLGLVIIPVALLPVANIFFTASVAFGERLAYLPILYSSLALAIYNIPMNSRFM